MKDPNRPKVPDLVPLIKAVYASPAGGAGCCLHIVTDDDNYGCAADCLGWAIEAEAKEPGQHTNCVKAAEMMTKMTKTQIAKATAMAYPK